MVDQKQDAGWLARLNPMNWFQSENRLALAKMRTDVEFMLKLVLDGNFTEHNPVIDGYGDRFGGAPAWHSPSWKQCQKDPALREAPRFDPDSERPRDVMLTTVVRHIVRDHPEWTIQVMAENADAHLDGGAFIDPGRRLEKKPLLGPDGNQLIGDQRHNMGQPLFETVVVNPGKDDARVDPNGVRRREWAVIRVRDIKGRGRGTLSDEMIDKNVDAGVIFDNGRLKG